MGKTPETALKDKARGILDALGDDCWHFKVVGGPSQKSGVPDTVGCYKGHFFAYELKIAPNKPSGKQLYEVGQIKKAGGLADVLWSLDDFEEYLERMKCLRAIR